MDPLLAETPYRVIDELHQGFRFRLFRAQHPSGRFVIKQALDLNPEAKVLARLRQEFHLGQRLEAPPLLRPLRLEVIEHRMSLVFEDFTGASLEQAAARRRFQKAEFLNLAWQAAQGLAQLHEHGLLHRNLEPSHLLYDAASGQVKLISLSQACPPEQLEGPSEPVLSDPTLAYQAPEFLGLIARPIDFRADLYSLGVIFYRLLAARSPFEGLEGIEILHAKTGNPPPPLDQLHPEIEPRLSQLVGRLMSIDPNDRYQSASGLAADLKALQADTKAPLGAQDRPVALHFPESYPHQRELRRELLAQIERQLGKSGALLTISGDSGLGKQQVLEHVEAEFDRQGWLMLRHNFEQGGLTWGLSAALERWLTRLYLEPSDEVDQWKDRLRQQMGPLPPVLLDFLPSLRHLGEMDRADRSQLVPALCGLLAVITREYGVVALVLEELGAIQERDLELLAELAQSLPQSIPCICTLRPDQSAQDALTHLSKRFEQVRSLSLKPMDPLQQQRVLEKILGQSGPEVARLARLMWDAAQGSPLHLRQTLESLQEQGVLSHHQGRGWSWDINQVKRSLKEEPLPHLIERRLERLQPDLKLMLQQAAIAGESVPLDLLAALCLYRPELLQDLIQRSQEAGLVARQGDQLRFVDRAVRQALLEQAPADLSAEVHLNLAVLLRHRHPDFGRTPLLFEVADHFNQACPLLKLPQEKLELARLNLAAGEWAEEAGLPPAALEYYRSGQQVLQDLDHPEQAHWSFELSWREMAALLRLQDLDSLRQRLADRREPTPPLERARWAFLELCLAQEEGRIEGALQALGQGLAALGLKLGPSLGPLPEDPQARLWAARLLGEACLSLLEQPGDAVLWAAQGIEQLVEQLPLKPAGLMALMIRAVEAAQAGNPHESEALAREAFEGAAKLGDQTIGGRLNLLYHGLLRPWTHPHADCAQLLWSDVEAALKHADRPWAVRGLLWRFGLTFEGPAGPARLAEGLQQARPLTNQSLRGLPPGAEQGFLGPEPSPAPFRGPLLAALKNLMCERQDRALEALEQAKTQAPRLVEAPYAILLAYLEGRLDPQARTSAQARLERWAKTQPESAAVAQVLRVLYLPRGTEPAQEFLEYSDLLERLDKTGQLLYDLETLKAYGRRAWRLNRPCLARALIRRLVESARKWGAQFKLQEAQHLYGQYFPDHPLNPPLEVVEADHPAPGRSSLLSALQAMAREINPQRLMPAMLQIIMEQAGAEKGMLFFIENGQPRLAADLCAEEGRLVSKDASYSQRVLNYLLHTGEDVVLDDAANRGPFIVDDYVQTHRVRSLLGALFKSGEEITGILYLENNRIEAAFGAGQMDTLRVLLGQARISFENARLYQRQQQLAEQLKDMDRLKDEFLANTSHELRTPLAGIIGMAEMMIDQPQAESNAERLQLIVQSGKRLTGLINDILDLSLLREERMQLKIAPIHLASLTDNILTLCRPLAGKRPIELTNRVGPELPAVAGDENRLQQILYNLVGNAIKFTPQGRVDVTAWVEGGQMTVEVADTGIGIEPEQLRDLFELFEKGQGRPDSEGTGLGLALTAQLVRLHKGEITVFSHPGQGSRFRFTLPLHQGKAEPLPPIEAHTPLPELVEAPRLQGAQGMILLVEDDAILQRTLTHYLNRSGYDVLSAIDGREALEILELEPKIDLVLLDLMLPELSGFEVCAAIRRRKGREELPVILLTARAGNEDIVKGFDVGANDYLVKPVQPPELLARVRAQIEVARSLERHKTNQRLQAEIKRRREAEHQLKARQRGLIRFFDQARTPVLVLDDQGRLGLLNRKAEELLGAQPGPEILKRFTKAPNPPEAPQAVNLEGVSWVLQHERLDDAGWMVFLWPPDAIGGDLEPLSDLGALAGGEGASLLREVRNLPARLDRADLPGPQTKQELMVELMNLSLRYWTQTTSRGKVAFAEESGIWNATIDRNGTYRTRTLDRYLKESSFPANPRWRDVLQTAYYVLQNCPEEAPELQAELAEKLHQLETFLRKD